MGRWEEVEKEGKVVGVRRVSWGRGKKKKKVCLREKEGEGEG